MEFHGGFDKIVVDILEHRLEIVEVHVEEHGMRLELESAAKARDLLVSSRWRMNA